MKQYLDLLGAIKEQGTYKAPARENMPGTTSLFGYQMRFNLGEGFPAMTTKKLYWKGVVTELLWFLRGDTNIKYLVDNGVNIWNEDAYNYYCKIASDNGGLHQNAIMYSNGDGTFRMYTFDEFIEIIKLDVLATYKDYVMGDCGHQYGKVSA